MVDHLEMRKAFNRAQEYQSSLELTTPNSNNLKNLYGVKMKKNFRDRIRFYINSKFPNKKVKIKFVTYSGKKVCNLKLTQKQSDNITAAAALSNETVQDFFLNSIKIYLKDKK